MVWMDGIVIKIRHNGRVQGKTIYLIIGLRKDGLKEVLGIWISETESASFWMNVLTDLKARGVEDILITCTDNLAGIRQAINAVFPDDQSAVKAVYLAINNIQKKWTMPIRSWGIIIDQFIIKFEDRCQI